MRSIVFILLICIAFLSCGKNSDPHLVNITSGSALKIISEERLSGFQLDSVIYQEKDSIYSLLFLDPEIDQNVFGFFLKHKISFYVFQKNKMIYHNLSHEFYQSKNIKSTDYLFYPHNGKSFHRLILENNSELIFLVKHQKKDKVKDLFEMRSLQSLSKSEIISDRIPLFEISTLNASISEKLYRDAEIKISTSKEVLDLAVKLKIRGSSSKNFPKKQLSIKTSESHYFRELSIDKSVLYAPYIDKSLLRNKLTYDLYAQMRNVSNPSVFTNVLFNGDYYGLYLLIAHPKAQFKKLVHPSDSSSFMVQIDRCPCEIMHTINSRKTAYIIQSPGKCSEPKKAQIDQVLSTFEQALFKEDLSSLDLNSFIDFIILNELSKNIDAYRLSTYLAFYGNKFRLPIVWDYNIAWGLAEHGNGFDYEGFVINGEYQLNHLFWWDNLWNNKLFQSALRLRYRMHRKNVLSKENILTLIKFFDNNLEGDVALNFKKWPLMGRKIWPAKYKTNSYKEELEVLKLWIDHRLVWLDKQWGGAHL